MRKRISAKIADRQAATEPPPLTGGLIRPLGYFSKLVDKEPRTLMRHVTGTQLPHLKAFRIGRSWYLTDGDWNEFLNACRGNGQNGRKPAGKAGRNRRS